MTWTAPDVQRAVYFRVCIYHVVHLLHSVSTRYPINSTEWRFLMETIRGRKSFALDFNGLKEKLGGANHILLDLGTGDGRYVHTLANKHPDRFVIGVDSCRENLREYSQAKLANTLFVIASAQNLPIELDGQINHVTINFPWGSLLESLLAGDAKLMRGLESISRP